MESKPQVDFDAITPQDLSNILSQLFMPSTDIVKQATALLKEYFKKINALENLLILMSTSPE